MGFLHTHTHTHTQTNLIDTSNHDLSVDTTTSYDDKWNASIKESSENTNIKLFFSRYASLVYQQSFLVSEYMILDNLYNFSNSGSTDDDILFFYGDTYYNYKDIFFGDRKNNETYWNVWDWETKYANENSHFKMVNNTQKLDSSFNSSYGNNPDENLISDLLQYYDSTNTTNNYKFDVWIADFGLYDFWNACTITSDTGATTYTDTFYKFFQHVDKIYILTDGNWQTYYFMEYCAARYCSPDYTQLTQEEIENLFNNYRSDTTNQYKSDFDSHQLYDFINDANLFTFFHTREYTNSPYWYSGDYKYTIPSNITLYDSYGINWNYYDFATKIIPTSTTTSGSINPQETFISDYEGIFNISSYKTLQEFFIQNIETYDPSKKNVIWLGDSLINSEVFVYPEKTNEMRNILQSWMKFFPSSEYNFIYKSHTSFQLNQQREYIQWLSKSSDDSSFIYFNRFPWEVFLSWNYKMQQTDSSYTGIFSEKNQELGSNVFVGFQFTSTVLQTTAFFLEDQYGYSLDQVESTLNPYYFPLPETFDVVVRTSSFSIAPEEQLAINKGRIADIYKPFVENNTYPNYAIDQISATDFIKQVSNPNYVISANDSSTWWMDNNPSNDGLSQSAKIAIGVVVPVVAIVACVTTTLIVKKKKGKKLQTA